MRKILAGLSALSLLGLMGCAHHVHEAKAEYHHERAEHEWDHGHPIKAAKEKMKENREENRAERHEHF